MESVSHLSEAEMVAEVVEKEISLEQFVSNELQLQLIVLARNGLEVLAVRKAIRFAATGAISGAPVGVEEAVDESLQIVDKKALVRNMVEIIEALEGGDLDVDELGPLPERLIRQCQKGAARARALMAV
jgi:hypothetical protein